MPRYRRRFYRRRRFRTRSSRMVFTKASIVRGIQRFDQNSYTFTAPSHAVPQNVEPTIDLNVLLVDTQCFRAFRQLYTYFTVRGLLIETIPDPDNTRFYYWDGAQNRFATRFPYVGKMVLSFDNNQGVPLDYTLMIDDNKSILLNPSQAQRKYIRINSVWTVAPSLEARNPPQEAMIPTSTPWYMHIQHPTGNLALAADEVGYPKWSIKLTFYVMWKNSVV